ncbi:uncharacterized protein DUF1574 [Ruminiclostridium sufflavum DSM 19573]|uniref:Uncharacterized protein DUF1574 n=1 Tax=Ruminiclostridium sufflavum DSM 19573 TaxID=1121337 RepID=A0A318XMS2_9FIRM|nr:D-alanyl-lipoteichoic acid biosynthesis protein DltD [Ruminiclostridium sufflavum]PYG89157.1 uncharacterized protein DUF1574 [Ruminiclostridium sufflavum DSM 19573]
MNKEMQLNNLLKRGLLLKHKNFLLCITFVFFFFAFDFVIGEVLSYYDHFDTPNMNSLMWDDFYKSEPNSIDVIFLGSSHARFAFDTETFDNNLNIKSFNLSSSEQTPLVGYYALKEVLKNQKPKLLVYEAYWRVFGIDDNTTTAYFVYDYIKGFDTRSQLLASIYDNRNFSSFLAEALSRTYKYRDSFFPTIKNVLTGRIIKPSSPSKHIKYADFTYHQNGYFQSDEVVNNEKLFENNPFEKAGLYFKWNETQIEYFKKTIKLCNDNNIKVLVITAPLPKPSMDYIKDYKKYSSKIMNIAKKFGLEYIDYNSMNIKEGNFKNEFFFDSNHLNKNGSEFLDNLLIPVIKKYLN